MNERMSTMDQGDQTSGGRRKGGSGILDPKIVRLDTFAGDKKDRRSFTRWRKCFENHAETYYPGIKALLEKCKKHEQELDIEEINGRLHEAGMNPIEMSWIAAKVDHDLQVFLEFVMRNF